MNTALQNIPLYLSKYISDKVSKDNTIINLSIGEPFFQPPTQVYDNLKEIFIKNNFSNISNKYSDSRGSGKLRKEISTRYLRLYNANVDPENEVIITHGAAEAIWLSILALTTQGEEVIIADPSYTLYETAVKLLGRVPVKLPTQAEHGFCLSREQIEKSLTPKTKLIIINSPENPTGAVYNRSLIKEIHELAIRNKIYFVHDEVYDSFILNHEHENIFRYQTHTDNYSVIINSFSKRYSMMGWRLGWMISSKKIIDGLTKIHTNLTLNLGTFHQEAAASVLNDIEVDKQIQKYIIQIADNLHLLGNTLSASDLFSLPYGTPTAGFFLFPDITKLYSVMESRFKIFNTKGEAVMEFLLDKHKLAVVPGYIYGPNSGDYIRIVAAVEENKVIESAERFKNIN